MPTPVLNNAATTDNYSDANTVVFTQPKTGFALNVANAAIYYQLAIPGQSGQLGNYTWESIEHYLLPTYTNFRNPSDEGFSGSQFFAGVRVRSAVTGTPARVTVI